MNILDNRKENLKIQRKNIDITNPEYTLKAYHSSLQNAKKIENNEENNKKIIELKNSKSSTKDFADFINTILLNIGIQLKLDLDGKDYILKHTNENIQLTVNDISEGEVNLLSLLFFYYELFDDDK